MGYTPQRYSAAHQQRRDTILQAALSEGRISPNSYSAWAQRYDANAQATEETLARLYPVVQAEPFPTAMPTDNVYASQ